MRKIIMSLAISLDGYIVDDQGQYDWIVGDGKTTFDSPEENRFSFDHFLDGIGTIVMGRRSYDLHGQDFLSHQVLVATHRPLPAQTPEHIIPLGGDIVEAILAIRADRDESEKDIWLFGGARLIAPFVAAGVIDRYVVGIIPTLLGGGTRLFSEGFERLPLELVGVSADSGIVVVQYEPRHSEPSQEPSQEAVQ